jgi:hypothetical protein
MNQYYMIEERYTRAQHQDSEALKKLFRILYPKQEQNALWSKPPSCDEVNNAIDRYLKEKLGKTTGDLCLDEYVRLFSNGEFDAQKTTIMGSIAEIVAHEDIIKKNIEDKYK